MNNPPQNKEFPTLMKVEDFTKKHSFLSKSTIRWMIFKSEPSFEECLVRISNRIYIDEAKFFEFLNKESAERKLKIKIRKQREKNEMD